MMFRNLRKTFLTVAVAVMMVLFMIPSQVSAASGLTVDGPDSVSGGEVFTVTVTYDADGVGRVSGNLTYDTEYLTYVSGGSSSGNIGYVQLNGAGTGEDITFSIKMQAIKEGSTSVSIDTSEMYDLNEMDMETPAGSYSVEITGDAAEDEKIIEEADAEDNAADEDGMNSVDEKTDEETGPQTEEAETPQEIPTWIFGVIAGVLLILIIMIAAKLRRK